MKIKSILIFLILLFAFSFNIRAQQKSANNNNVEDTALLKPQKSITQGSVSVEGNHINYQAIAGTLILKNKEEKPTCSMFYTAYFKTGESDISKRPVTFIYGGGPGFASFVLHFVAWGPQCVYLEDTAHMQPPFKTVNNDFCLLDASDLVFIDAPGTGFSQIISKEKGGVGETKDFYGADPDAQAFASFITQFLSIYNLWNSPKYLMGESYGTFRSAILSNILETQGGVALNGVIQLSQTMNYNNWIAKHDPGTDLPFELALPTHTAVAWYHHKLPDRPEKLEPLLKEVQHFAMTDYAYVLSQGFLLDSVSFNEMAEKLHNYTGLPIDYIRKANLRVGGHQFQHELLSGDGLTASRLDGRFTGYNLDPLGEFSIYDPGFTTIIKPLIATFNNYVHTQLKFGVGETYAPFGNSNIISQWDFTHKLPDEYFNFYTNVMPDLAQAMIFNPRLKVMLNMGYFDMTTPFGKALYETHHLPIAKALQKNIEYYYYYSGHFIFLNKEAHKQLHDNVAKFIEGAH
jgi:carboxypeptidase C (cathepsin A)